jgi:hypothetical protein
MILRTIIIQIIIIIGLYSITLAFTSSCNNALVSRLRPSTSLYLRPSSTSSIICSMTNIDDIGRKVYDAAYAGIIIYHHH